MSRCDLVSQVFGDRVRGLVKWSEDNQDSEAGFPIYRDLGGHFSAGSNCYGNSVSCAMDFPSRLGESRYVGSFHVHPPPIVEALHLRHGSLSPEDRAAWDGFDLSLSSLDVSGDFSRGSEFACIGMRQPDDSVRLVCFDYLSGFSPRVAEDIRLGLGAWRRAEYPPAGPGSYESVYAGYVESVRSLREAVLSRLVSERCEVRL